MTPFLACEVFGGARVAELIQHSRPMISSEKAAQRVSFGAGHPADVHADIPADVRGKSLGQALEILETNKLFGANIHDPKARTSMTPGG